MNCHLQGLSILVTRPAKQSDELCELIEQMHGRPIRFPALEITEAKDPKRATSQLNALTQADLVIFVSRNAVEYSFPLLPDELPLNLEIAAIGQATGTALSEHGLNPSLMPDDKYDSESLLALPKLQDMQGKTVVLVRGNGGRALLEQELAARGATVHIAEVYQRLIPQRNPANIIASWGRMVDVVTATSNELLDNLFTMLGEQGGRLLTNTPLVVISTRMADHAKERGCRKIYLASNASNQGILEALCEM